MTRGPDRPAVFFASDYGTDDEFVGVVHAVLHRLAPEIPVIDLSHQILPFDVAGGADLLVRSAPFLGNGVVLAVVDPGVGTDRRGVALRTAGTPAHAVRPGYPGLPSAPAATADRPAWLVGPDNGLLMAAADLLGGVREAIWLHPEDDRWPGPPAVTGSGPTFDGRDVFAPATAALAKGAAIESLGIEVSPETLVELPAPSVTFRELDDGRLAVTAAVRWIDRYGNVQLALPAQVLADARTSGLVVRDEDALVRVVRTFSELDRGTAGLLSDANGAVALVVAEGSAAQRFRVTVGDRVELVGDFEPIR